MSNFKQRDRKRKETGENTQDHNNPFFIQKKSEKEKEKETLLLLFSTSISCRLSVSSIFNCKEQTN